MIICFNVFTVLIQDPFNFVFGKMLHQHLFKSTAVDDDKLRVTKANVAERYFGAGAGIGAKYKFEINRKEFFIGFEALYDYGFTNTYGKQERDGKSIDVGHLVDYENVPLKGKRSFTGVEMQVTFGMPFDFNFHRREKPQTTRSVRNL